MGKGWIGAAAWLGALGVALGAFGAHALRGVLPLQMMTIFNTGVQYHLVHSLALLATGVLMVAAPAPPRALELAARLFTAGIALFSGSLYVLATTGFERVGWLTPLGGLAFLGGWVALAVGSRGLRGARRG